MFSLAVPSGMKCHRCLWKVRCGARWLKRADLNANEMSFIAYAPGPILLRFSQEFARPYAHYRVIEIMTPSPELKEFPHQLSQRLGVVLSKI